MSSSGTTSFLYDRDSIAPYEGFTLVEVKSEFSDSSPTVYATWVIDCERGRLGIWVKRWASYWRMVPRGDQLNKELRPIGMGAAPHILLLRDQVCTKAFGTYPHEPPAVAQVPNPEPRPVPPTPPIRREPTSTGSGFVIGAGGEVITNYHVVEDCRAISVRDRDGAWPSRVVRHDARADLALLRADHTFRYVASIRGGSSLALGDQVVVVGYPLSGLLAQDVNVTTGIVSALAGLGNDSGLLQISAPVQKGNSGGPLLDGFGNVAGIVVSKLNALAIAKETGDIPQNVNFAIKVEVLRAFLDASAVKPRLHQSARMLDVGQIAERGREFTVLIECY